MITCVTTAPIPEELHGRLGTISVQIEQGRYRYQLDCQASDVLSSWIPRAHIVSLGTSQLPAEHPDAPPSELIEAEDHAQDLQARSELNWEMSSPLPGPLPEAPGRTDFGCTSSDHMPEWMLDQELRREENESNSAMKCLKQSIEEPRPAHVRLFFLSRVKSQ